MAQILGSYRSPAGRAGLHRRGGSVVRLFALLVATGLVIAGVVAGTLAFAFTEMARH